MMTVQLPTHAVLLDGTVSVQEAASRLGCSEKTIRRRIKAGTLPAHRLPTSQGYEWRVDLNGTTDQSPSPAAVQVGGQSDQLPGAADHVDTQASGRPDAQVPVDPQNEPLLKALGLVERLQRENMELAGRVGFLQAKLQSTEEQLLALTAGSEPAAAATAEPDGSAAPAVTTPWQRFLSLFRSQ
jgi:excisionase family DNA binding protein